MESNAWNGPTPRSAAEGDHIVCPMLENADARCATHLTLANISSAFAHCADQYESCPVYRKAIAELFDHVCQYGEESVAAGVLVA